ncbi:MAG: M42 family metallopeptidase, partial [Clostridium sp.]
IEKLTQINGISGHEDEVRKELYNHLKDYSDEVSFDNIGSIIFTKKSNKENAPKVMIAAHIDQIGFVITRIDDKGFCYFKPIGGWYPTQLLTQEVTVKTEEGKEYVGVIGHVPVKVLKEKKEIDFRDMFIDFGVSSKEELHGFGINVGDPLTPVSTYKPLCNNRFVATKAWDNRVGCAIIAEVLKALKDVEIPCDLHLAGTVQEEVGIRGGKTASYKINPDIGISIDIGAYGDTPGIDKYDSSLELGKGPSIAVLDATAIGNTKMVRFAKKVAKEGNIPYQTDVMLAGGTDTGAMHINREGSIGLTISIPTRYGHSHNSIIHLDDLENSVKLFVEMIKSIDDKMLKEMKTFI